MKTNLNYIILFKSCFPVKGAKNAAIVDVQRSKSYRIPMSLYELVTTDFPEKSIGELEEEYAEQLDTLKEYIDFLLENELAQISADKNLGEPIQLDFELSTIIDNAIIEINEGNIDFATKAVAELDDLGCKFLELRCLTTPFNTITALFDRIAETKIRGIIIYLSYVDVKIDDIISIMLEYPRIVHLTLHSVPSSILENFNFESNRYAATTQNMNLNQHCGVINQSSFSSYIDVFSELQNFNGCLNGKVSVDQNGQIKNCPSMQKTYGNIDDTTLREVIEQPDFNKLWDINKDKILVCKDCEYRYICTDCRAFVEDPEDIHSKPLKCGYNPYTGEWNEWSINPLKQNAIDFYERRYTSAIN